MNITKHALHELAHLAVANLLDQTPVIITRHKDAPRNGMPLPIKKVAPNQDGYVTQEYRPLAILEYVNDVLSGDLARRQAKERKAALSQVQGENHDNQD